MVSSGITREEVIQWGGAEVFNQALALVNAGDVVKVEYDDAAVEIRGKIEQAADLLGGKIQQFQEASVFESIHIRFSNSYIFSR